jgi:hypothetical protein
VAAGSLSIPPKPVSSTSNIFSVLNVPNTPFTIDIELEQDALIPKPAANALRLLICCFPFFLLLFSWPGLFCCAASIPAAGGADGLLEQAGAPCLLIFFLSPISKLKLKNNRVRCLLFCEVDETEGGLGKQARKICKKYSVRDLFFRAKDQHENKAASG